MKVYDDDVWESLIDNNDETFNRGYGFLIKPDVSNEQRQKLRKIQDKELEEGVPYWISIFLQKIMNSIPIVSSIVNRIIIVNTSRSQKTPQKKASRIEEIPCFTSLPTP